MGSPTEAMNKCTFAVKDCWDRNAAMKGDNSGKADASPRPEYSGTVNSGLNASYLTEGSG